MAHFAQLDENNIVINLIVINNNVIKNLEFPESEEIGVEFCQFLYGENTIWKQASYNGNFRKKFPGVGFIYNKEYDIFHSVRPYPSWSIDPIELDWVAPVPCPGTRDEYYWVEETLSWEHF